MNCPTCKTEMKALASSVYCPRDCDRIPEAVDDAPTEPYVSVAACPNCGSKDIAPFETLSGPALEHCWPCGRLWQRRIR